MKRGSSTSSTTARLTEPTSLTTHSGPAAASTSRTVAASVCTGAATKAKSASATAACDGVVRVDDRPTGDRRLTCRRRRVVAAHVRPEALAGGQADRATDQPHADDGDPHAAALRTLPATAAARSTCSR